MADRAIDKLQPRTDGAQTYLFHLVIVADTLHMGVRTEIEINGIGIFYGLLRKIIADKPRKIPADFGGKRKLAVRKCARAGKAGGYVAIRLAVHAVLRDALRAFAVFDRPALFDDKDALSASLADQLQRGEYARGARADDDNIFFHDKPRFKQIYTDIKIP